MKEKEDDRKICAEGTVWRKVCPVPSLSIFAQDNQTIWRVPTQMTIDRGISQMNRPTIYDLTRGKDCEREREKDLSLSLVRLMETPQENKE